MVTGQLANFNTPFFSLYENMYLILQEECGEQEALSLFKKVMTKGLKKAYDAISFHKGDPKSFQEVITARDNSVGLVVSFPEVKYNKIICQLCIDPFANLKGIVKHNLLDSTYIDFKIEYLLGDGWFYNTTKHFWKGDTCIEFIIQKQ